MPSYSLKHLLLWKYFIGVVSIYDQLTFSKEDDPWQSGWVSSNQLKGFKSKTEVPPRKKKPPVVWAAVSAPAREKSALQISDLPTPQSSKPIPWSLSLSLCGWTLTHTGACTCFFSDREFLVSKSFTFQCCNLLHKYPNTILISSYIFWKFMVLVLGFKRKKKVFFPTHYDTKLTHVSTFSLPGNSKTKKCVMSSQGNMTMIQKVNEKKEFILYNLYWNAFTVSLAQTPCYSGGLLNKRMGIFTLAYIPLHWCLLSIAWKLTEECCLHLLWWEDKVCALLIHRNRFPKMTFIIF